MRGTLNKEWQVWLVEAANVKKPAIAANVGDRSELLGLFRNGLAIIGIGLVLGALTLAFDTVVLPIAAGAALFVGCMLAADAVERYRCVE